MGGGGGGISCDCALVPNRPRIGVLVFLPTPWLRRHLPNFIPFRVSGRRPKFPFFFHFFNKTNGPLQAGLRGPLNLSRPPGPPGPPRVSGPLGAWQGLSRPIGSLWAPSLPLPGRLASGPPDTWRCSSRSTNSLGLSSSSKRGVNSCRM